LSGALPRSCPVPGRMHGASICGISLSDAMSCRAQAAPSLHRSSLSTHMSGVIASESPVYDSFCRIRDSIVPNRLDSSTKLVPCGGRIRNPVNGRRSHQADRPGYPRCGSPQAVTVRQCHFGSREWPCTSSEGGQPHRIVGDPKCEVCPEVLVLGLQPRSSVLQLPKGGQRLRKSSRKGPPFVRNTAIAPIATDSAIFRATLFKPPLHHRLATLD